MQIDDGSVIAVCVADATSVIDVLRDSPPIYHCAICLAECWEGALIGDVDISRCCTASRCTTKSTTSTSTLETTTASSTTTITEATTSSAALAETTASSTTTTATTSCIR